MPVLRRYARSSNKQGWFVRSTSAETPEVKKGARVRRPVTNQVTKEGNAFFDAHGFADGDAVELGVFWLLRSRNWLYTGKNPAGPPQLIGEEAWMEITDAVTRKVRSVSEGDLQRWFRLTKRELQAIRNRRRSRAVSAPSVFPEKSLNLEALLFEAAQRPPADIKASLPEPWEKDTLAEKLLTKWEFRQKYNYTRSETELFHPRYLADRWRRAQFAFAAGQYAIFKPRNVEAAMDCLRLKHVASGTIFEIPSSHALPMLLNFLRHLPPNVTSKISFID